MNALYTANNLLYQSYWSPTNRKIKECDLITFVSALIKLFMLTVTNRGRLLHPNVTVSKLMSYILYKTANTSNKPLQSARHSVSNCAGHYQHFLC
jgi:hypothetical protein